MLFTTLFVILFSVFQVQSIVVLRGQVEPADDQFYADSLSGLTLTIKIEDVSLQDVGSVVLSERTIRLSRGKKFPAYFEIVYPKSVLDSDSPAHFFAISARLTNTISGELVYITDEAIHLPRNDEIENLITMRVIKVGDNTLIDRDTCRLPAETGNCLASFQRFYFDSKSQTCKQFVYGGCGGNLNRFETEQDCYSNCLPQLNKPVDSANRNTELCQLDKEVGPCRAALPRFYYNRETKQCEQFMFGGCRGNENNFRTAESCASACQ